MGQFQPVHAAGHVDVREKKSDIGTRFQQDNRFVRIPGLDRNEPRFLDDFDGKHPQHRFILYDKDDWQSAAGYHRYPKPLSIPPLIRFIEPLLRHPKAVRFQIWGEGFLGELPELRGQTQALELSHLIVASVVPIRHGVCSQTGEMSGRTSTLSLSVVQTTKPKPIAQDHWNSAGELFCSDSLKKSSHT
jgi:hypothetical protein